ncbi:hypothetical protein D9M68_967450 [compost metagenome]
MPVLRNLACVSRAALSAGLLLMSSLPSLSKYQRPAPCIITRMRPPSCGSMANIFLPVLASTCLPISMKRSQVMFCMSLSLKPACLIRSVR